MVTPKKNPPNGFLTPEEQLRNDNIAHDRILVENFFGRACTKFGILVKKYRWDKGAFRLLVDICFSLTNYHISMFPLRRNDYDFYQEIKMMHVHSGTLKRKEAVTRMRRYRKKLKSQQAYEDLALEGVVSIPGHRGREASTEEDPLDLPRRAGFNDCPSPGGVRDENNVALATGTSGWYRIQTWSRSLIGIQKGSRSRIDYSPKRARPMTKYQEVLLPGLRVTPHPPLPTLNILSMINTLVVFTIYLHLYSYNLGYTKIE